MGHKTHPYGFRLGIIKDWHTHWYAPRGQQYRALVQEDLRVRRAIRDEYARFSDAGIARVEINRGNQDVEVNVHSARPGILIGRDGERVKRLRQRLETLTGKRIQLNIIEVQHPEREASLVARSIADQLERRVAYRRAMRQAAARAMQAGAKGIKIIVSGRIMGAEIARREKLMEGRVPLHTLRADIDFGLAEAHTVMGRIGVKVWIYKGDILPAPKEEAEEMAPIEVTLSGSEETDATAQAGEAPQGAPRPADG